MNIFLVWVYVIILTVSSVTKAFIPDLYIVVFLVSSGPCELYYYSKVDCQFFWFQADSALNAC